MIDYSALKSHRGGKVGRAMRAGPRSRVKNAGRADVFNPLTRISPPRIIRGPHGPTAGRGGLAR